MRCPALICAPTRLASYIVTGNVPASYLALHHDQDLLYYRAEDSDVVEATLYDGATSDICPCLCALCSPGIAEYGNRTMARVAELGETRGLRP